MAWSKIVGLEVRPVTESSAMYCLSVPLLSRSRVMLSSQILWPRLCKSSVAFIFVLFLVGFVSQQGIHSLCVLIACLDRAQSPTWWSSFQSRITGWEEVCS